MSKDFMLAVEDGLKLAKRIYFGKDRSVAPPRPPPPMSKSPRSYLPTAPMVYAVIADPAIVDNPDIPSYQPHVYGRCDPPALIPLHMFGVSMEVDCYMDTAVIRVSGTWRVHCVMGSKSCDCKIAVPLGEQGSILGVGVDILRKSYHTEVVAMEDGKDGEKVVGVDDGGYLKPNIFTMTIPQVDGGSNLSIKISWSQKLVYHNGEFSLCVPFSFPEYVTPAGKKIPKREKIQMRVLSGDTTEVSWKAASHSFREQKRQVGYLSLLYEADVLAWSTADLSFSYAIPATHISGSVLLQSPSVDDIDQREMFYIHILPGSQQHKKVFARKLVYVIDISSSMQGKPLEATKDALCAAISELNPEDTFNIIAFNGKTFQFSSSLESASKDSVEKAKDWMHTNFIPGNDTDIFPALNQAIEMLSDAQGSLPMIFLVTDGAVEEERCICDIAKTRLSNWKHLCPRIHTFGIGSFCNHYFLRMLAMIGRGHYDAAYDTDFIEHRLWKLFSRASSTIMANITFDALNELDEVEVLPTHVPDLSSESTLILSGRYSGEFPDVLKARGISTGLKSCEVELKVQRAKDFPLDKMLALQHISMHTAQAWFSQDKQLEQKVAKMSILTGIVSEYTHMILLETEKSKKLAETGSDEKHPSSKGDSPKEDPKPQRIKTFKTLGVGFGNLKATVENTPPGSEEQGLPEAAEIIVKAASNCCAKLFGYCCCMCCIETCSKMNNQCAIVLTQLCTAFACFGCLECCTEICCSGQDGS